MRALLLACALLAPPVARAQAVACPKSHPDAGAAKLIGAGMYVGEKGGRGELQGDHREVKGGSDTRFGFAHGDVRWLVCYYGSGDVTWWQQMDSQATSCTLEIRDRKPVSARGRCR